VAIEVAGSRYSAMSAEWVPAWRYEHGEVGILRAVTAFKSDIWLWDYVIELSALMYNTV